MRILEEHYDTIIDNISFSEIRKSKIHGLGLFATTSIKKDTILGMLDGQVMDWDHYNKLAGKIKEDLAKYKDYIFMEWNALDSKTLLVRPFRTKYSYINHSKKPNLEIKYNPMRVVAIKNIEETNEFTLDYTKEPLSQEYLDGHGKTYL